MKFRTRINSIVLSLLILFVLILCFFIFNNKSSDNTTFVNNEISVNSDYDTFNIGDRFSILAVHPQKNKIGYKDIYIENKKTNQSELLFHSDARIQFVEFNNELSLPLDNKNSLIAFYEYTESTSTKGMKTIRPLLGHVFIIDKDGTKKEIYTQINSLESMSFEDNQLIIQEKLFNEENNQLPESHREYTIIKKVYINGEFVEKERTKISPNIDKEQQ